MFSNLTFLFSLRNKFFNKILLTFAVIIIITLITLSSVMTINTSSALEKKEIGYDKLILMNVNSFLTSKFNLTKSIMNKIYTDNVSSGSPIYTEPLQFLDGRFDKLDAEYISLKPKFDNYFMSFIPYDSDISNILVSKVNTNTVYMYSKYYNAIFDEDNLEEMHNYPLLKNKYPILNVFPAYTPSYPLSRNEKLYTLSTNINSLAGEKVLGILFIDFNTGGIKKLLEQYGKDFKGYILILTQNGEVVFDSSDKYYNNKYPYSEMVKKDQKNVRINGEACTVNVITNNDMGFSIVSIIPRNVILSDISATRNTIFIITFLCILLSILLTYASTKLFSKRIKTIITFMKKVRLGDLSARIPLSKPTDEIGEISLNFNIMCDHLNEHINKVYISGLKQKSAELTALQAQINPHFLYNTLEAIRMKAVSAGDTQVAEMTFTLAKLFRNSIKEGQIISIQDEIKYSKLYLKLFEIRYGDKLSVDFEISEDILECGVTKHLIQPVIENYIMHGFDIESENNNISIRGFKDGENIIIIIVDNGRGMDTEKLSALRNSLENFDINQTNVIGLNNINERIKIIYGNECGIDIASEKDKGTAVTIKILARTKKELEEYVQSINSR